VCITINQPDTKTNPNPNFNPTPTCSSEHSAKYCHVSYVSREIHTTLLLHHFPGAREDRVRGDQLTPYNLELRSEIAYGVYENKRDKTSFLTLTPLLKGGFSEHVFFVYYFLLSLSHCPVGCFTLLCNFAD